MSDHDDLSEIDGDDKLLDAIAAGTELGPDADAAAQLLAEIVAAVDAEKPDDRRGPGGGSRRGVWGITLGVAILIAAGGSLSAVARTGMPTPVQAVVSSVGGPVIDSAPLPSITLDHPSHPTGHSAVRVPSQSAPPALDRRTRWREFVWREFAAADGGRAVSPWAASAAGQHGTRSVEPYNVPSLWQPLTHRTPLEQTAPARPQSAPVPAPTTSRWPSAPPTADSWSWSLARSSQARTAASPLPEASAAPTSASSSEPTTTHASTTHPWGQSGWQPSTAPYGTADSSAIPGAGQSVRTSQPAPTQNSTQPSSTSSTPSTPSSGQSWHPQWQSGGAQFDHR